MALVVDASICVAWYIPGEETPLTERVLDRLEQESATVPSVWPLEMANALLKAERVGRLSEAASARIVESLSNLPIVVDTDGLARAFYFVRTLARSYGLTSYDASYLELAMRLGLPLATLARNLAKAATSVGVQLIS